MAEQFDTLEAAFPVVDVGLRPVGSNVLIQLRRTKKTTKSGLILVEETRDTERAQNAIGKVLAIGPLAYKHRDSMVDWPEGAWCKVGDYVRLPRWSGDRFSVELPKAEGDDSRAQPEEVNFTTIKDHEIWSVLEERVVLSMKSYI